jgi:hypothetical protein
MAGRGDAVQGDVAGPLDGPFVILLQQDRTDEAGDGSWGRCRPPRSDA